MKSLWRDELAATYSGDMGLRIYTSRLLGSDPSLVLHGGGNTSVKLDEEDLFGRRERVTYVKGSGWDLATIEEAGFSPVKQECLINLSMQKELTDQQMARELRKGLTNPYAPDPSVEAILHGIIPERFVDHTHADAVITVMNTPSGEQRVREIYGDTVVIIPYVMPGFRLARECALRFPQDRRSSTIGMILMNHGVVSFGETAKESYDRMVFLVSQSEEYLKTNHVWDVKWRARNEVNPMAPAEIAALRHSVSNAAGVPMIVRRHTDTQTLGFVQREDLSSVCNQGPSTPDHVLRTKRVPLVGMDIDQYVKDYRSYYDANCQVLGASPIMLDPAPRVVLDANFGMFTCGKSAREANIAEQIYRHTMQIITRASDLEAYQALPSKDIFEVEYWDLEQAKLKRQRSPKPFEGEVALVTGAASGIGRACVDAFLAQGAAVIGIDVSKSVAQILDTPHFTGIQCDLTDPQETSKAVAAGVEVFGGIDIAVLNAGIFPASRSVELIDSETWRRTMAVNLDANQSLLRLLHPLLRLAPRNGRVIVVGSKNVPAPGPGAGAYSASKAGLTQLARVAAIEWGADGIRVNIIHPNSVFDTSIWTDEILAARAKSYGMSIEQYKTNNVLHVEIKSSDVAALIVTVAGHSFSKTTGAQIPIDGGNDRVI